VRYLGESVRIEVADQSTKPPTVRAPEPDEIGGRGLRLVDSVSSAWGFDAHHDGKTVWCEVAVSATR
jgi:hypothetical protein